jgi:hypothetical protein
MRIGDLLDPGPGVEKFGSGLLHQHPGFPVLFLTPGSRMEKTRDPRSGIQNKHTGSYFRKLGNNFWVKNTSILCLRKIFGQYGILKFSGKKI